MQDSKYCHNTKSVNKVGIITNYANTNYGSILQSYALQQALKSLGIRCENIQWSVNKKPSLLYRTARAGYRIIADSLSAPRRRVERFKQFRQKYIQESKKSYSSIEELAVTNTIYDAFICGSDQIWAPNQFHERYYLGFAGDDKLKIAYAPSIGLPKIPETLAPRMADLIKRIDHLSIREEEGARIVKSLTGRNAEVVLDPTLLLNKNEWLKVAADMPQRKKYILCYFLGENNRHRKAAESWSKKTGLPLVVLPFRDIDFKWGNIRIADAGPDIFLSLVDGAQWILTDSYHGMIFSIIMNKPFSVFMRFTEDHPLCQNSRIKHLLNRLGLMNRIVTGDTIDVNYDDMPDYKMINEIISKERTTSICYLKNALGISS